MPHKLFSLGLLLLALPAHAQELAGKIVAHDFYAYHAGDDTVWARPDFDDSDWEKIRIGTFPFDRWQGIGWLRFVLEVDSTLWNVPLALFVFHARGADEFYLDGELVHRIGKVGTTEKDEEAHYGYHTPQIITFRPTSKMGGGKSRHLIAERYSSFYQLSPVWSDGRNFSHWRIQSYGEVIQASAQRDNFRRKVTTHQMLLTGVFLAFSLMHLLLFLFYPQARANLYFAALSASFALTVYVFFPAVNYYHFITDPADLVWAARLQTTAMILMMLLAIRLTHFLIRLRLPSIFFAFCFVGLSVALLYWFRPFKTPLYLVLFLIATFAEILRALVVSRIKKRKTQLEGRWIILLGLIPLWLTAVYYLLAEDWLAILPLLWEFSDFPAPFYAMVLLMISMSVFLSRNFARTAVENARKTQELEEARKLQLSMLPQHLPILPNLEIAAEMKTATEVGGDYYDFHVAEDGALTVAIGDATGHGTKAGTMVTSMKTLFNTLESRSDLVRFLKECSKTIKSMHLGNLYMAITLARVKSHTIEFSGAGMPPILIYRAATGHVEEVALKGMPLGSFPNFPYQQQQLSLDTDDTILFMSDGFPERFNVQKEMLGEERAKTLFAEAAGGSPEQIIAHLLKEENAWANGRPHDDDVTFVVMKMK